jgi:hypothetical protein
VHWKLLFILKLKGLISAKVMINQSLSQSQTPEFCMRYLLLAILFVNSIKLLGQTPTPPAGSGTALDPYQIATLDNLYWLSQTPAVWDRVYDGSWNVYHFELAADIDATNTAIWDNGKGFSPIGNETDEFHGHFDGKGHTISNLTIDRSDEDNVGLFGFVEVRSSSYNTVIKNLNLNSPDIVGGNYTGALTGTFMGDTLQNCQLSDVDVTGAYGAGGLAGRLGDASASYADQILLNSNVDGSVAGETSVGMLVGIADEAKLIAGCTTAGTVTGKERVGGAIGYLFSVNRVSNCSSSATPVSSQTIGSSNYFGGFAGYFYGYNVIDTVEHCYATGNLSIYPNGTYVGGFAGYFQQMELVRDCYALGFVYVQGEDAAYVGGFTGYINASNASDLVVRCRALGDVTLDQGDRYLNIGGFAGRITLDGSIEKSFSVGTVSVVNNLTWRGGDYIGGFAGTVTSTGEIRDCYTRSTVNGDDNDKIGGFIGAVSDATIRRCYSAGPITASAYGDTGYKISNFIGDVDADAVTSANYYDKTVALLPTGTGATGLTTAQMGNSGNFSGWNFASTWEIVSGDDYPSFQWYNDLPATPPLVYGVSGDRQLGQSLRLQATINPNGLSTEYRFRWGSSSGNYTSETSWIGIGSGESGVNVNHTPTGLSPLSAYYFVAEARNSEGTTLSSENSATTTIATATPPGAGTSGDRYRLSTVDHLAWFMHAYWTWGAYFQLSADIDASATSTWYDGAGFIPVGTSANPFTGDFTGTGHTINGLYVNRDLNAATGFFGHVDGGRIVDTGILNAQIIATGEAGGLAGKIENSSYIFGCFAIADVFSTDRAGGLIGRSNASSVINCYAGGVVETNGSSSIGGLIGYFWKGFDESAEFRDCYAYTEVLAPDAEDRLGLVGGYGEYGSPYTTIRDLYWDRQASGTNLTVNNNRTGSPVGVSRTTAQMKQQATFAFDFSSTWGIIENQTYPYLQWQASAVTAKPTVVVLAPGDIAATSAKLNGNINPNNAQTDWKFRYGLASDALTMETTELTIAAGGAPVLVQASISGLTPVTTYYYQLVAENSEGVSVSEPVQSFATTVPYATPAGSGTVGNPYVIVNPGNLNWMSQTPSSWDKHFIVGNDIDLSGSATWNNGHGFIPIGEENDPFTGTLDGNGYVLSNLYMDYPNNEYEMVGLFASIEGGNIQNLNLVDIDITGYEFVGGIAGYLEDTDISNCSVSGSLACYYRYSGGIAGRALSTSGFRLIQNCDIDLDVLLIGNFDVPHYSGGLLGSTQQYNATNINSDVRYVMADGRPTTYQSTYNGSIFGYAQVGATITDVTAKYHATSEKTTWYYRYFGGVIGYMRGALTLQDVEVEIDASGAIHSVGGVCGSAYIENGALLVQNVTVNGTIRPSAISNTSDFGGLMGALVSAGTATFGSITNIAVDLDIVATGDYKSNIGGVFGNLDFDDADALIENIHHTGDISSAEGTSVGGFAGRAEATNTFLTTIRDCSHSGAVLTSNAVTNVGGFVGRCGLGILIRNSAANGNVSGNNYIGGFAGYIQGSVDANYPPTIDSCIVAAATVSGAGGYLGGFAGYSSYGKLMRSFSPATVQLASSGSQYVGGFIGYGRQDTVKNCYATGPVTSNGPAYVGGFGGYAYQSVWENNFSTGKVSGDIDKVGGFVGTINIPAISDCFWDTDSSYQLTSAAGTGKTHTEMQQLATFSPPWDFSGTWGIIEGESYPYLLWQAPAANQPPLISDLFSDNIDADRADVSATINPYGSETTYKVEYRTTSGGYVASAEYTLGAGYSDVAVSITLVTLQSETDYFYRYVATNDEGTTTTDEYTFTTLIATQPPAGSGTDIDPYVVASVNNLLWVALHPAEWDKVYFLNNDIDASSTVALFAGRGFPMIGREGQPFTGKFHGNGKTISNLFISASDSNGVGLFGYANGAVIDSIGIVNADINGQEQVGILIGNADGGTQIRNCYSSGTVAGDRNIGGLIGWLANAAKVENCYSQANVSGSVSVVGGLVGYNALASVDTCYAAGAVLAAANAGGLVGKDFSGTIRSSFWDITTSGQASSAGGAGKTNGEMYDTLTFVNEGWDYSRVWRQANGFTYPEFPVATMTIQVQGKLGNDDLQLRWNSTNTGAFPTELTFHNTSPVVGIIPAPGNEPLSEYYWTIGGTESIGGTGLTISMPTSGVYGIDANGDLNNISFLQRPQNDAGAWELINTTPVGSNLVGSGSINHYAGIGIGLLALVNTNGNDQALPVELTGLSAAPDDNGIQLSWQTLSESNNLGFEIYRSTAESGTYEQVASYRSDENLLGLGTSATGRAYSWRDPQAGLVAQTDYFYKICDVSLSGEVSWHGPLQVQTLAIPEKFALRQNYPNPFNPSTTIALELPQFVKDSRLIIYDIAGRKVRTLFEGAIQQHRFKIVWNGDNEHGARVATGVYFYHFSSSHYQAVRKMILIK